MEKAALVTGGTKRIGHCITMALAERGYAIALHYNHSSREAEETAEEITRQGGKCRLFRRDLSDSYAPASLIEAVFEAFPGCNLLINNASIFEPGGLMGTAPDEFDRQFAVNFKAPFFLTQHFARHCELGHVVNLLDTKVKETLTHYFLYGLTKKALYDFTRMAAKELAPQIRVNGICPGLILPPTGEDENYLKEKAKHIPLRKIGHPDYIVSALLFLIDNDYLTGECIFVDGGERLK